MLSRLFFLFRWIQRCDPPGHPVKISTVRAKLFHGLRIMEGQHYIYSRMYVLLSENQMF